MRILLFGLEYSPIIGGGGSYLEYIGLGLARLGNEVCILTSGDSDGYDYVEQGLSVHRSKIYKDLYLGKGDIFSGVNECIKTMQNKSLIRGGLETLVTTFNLKHQAIQHERVYKKYDNK